MVEVDELAQIVTQAIEMATAPLAARLAVLEQTKALQPEKGERGERGDQGPAGRDADPTLLAEYRSQIDRLQMEVETLKSARVDVQEIATKAISLMPTPKDGRDAPPVDLDAVVAKAVALMPVPRDGKDAAPVDFEAVVAKAVSLMPVPKDGKDGKDAPPVDIDALAVKAAALVPRPADGRDGRDGASLSELVPVIQGEVTKAISAIPVPKDGTPGPKGDPGQPGERGPEGPPGRDGRDGSPGSQGERGQDGRDGKDGADGQMGLEGPKGEQGQPGDPGRAGADGQNGKDGADGLGFDDMDLVVDEAEKAVYLRFSRGDVVKQFPVPVLMDAGVYTDEQTYRKGHAVTRGGSVWIALRDVVKGIQPGDGTPESGRTWRLAVQRGKEGKQGKPGPPGRDLRWEHRDE